MTSITIKLDPKGKYYLENLRHIEDNIRTGIRRGFYEAGKHLVATAKNNMLSKKSGKFYRFKGRRYQASAPGEAPKSVSGALRKTIDFKVRGADSLEFGYTSELKYGGLLEKGNIRGRGSAESKKRPGLEISMRANSRNIQIFLVNRIKEQLYKGIRHHSPTFYG